MDSFESLFHLHHKALCNLAFNMVRDKDAAKDIVQDVFFKLWKRRLDVDFGDKIKHYLFSATAHASLNYIRFNKKILRVSDNLDFEKFASSTTNEDPTSFAELEIKVRSAVERLPPKCKAIYLMSRQEGLKYQEIAQALEISLKTVENQMGIALQKLREELKPFLTREFIILLLASSVLAALLFF